MLVRDAMSSVVLTIGPSHSLRHAAKRMSEQRVGAAVVHDDDGQGPSILTERDILDSVAAGHDFDVELAGDHLTQNAVIADPEWSLDAAATAMLRGGFRHLVVCQDGAVVGVLSMRDVVRCWAQQPAHTGA
jgi:CBS domain-containing protein